MTRRELPYDVAVTTAAHACPQGDDWVDLCAGALPVAAVGEWLVRPDCGATVVFTGTARDHSEDRDGVDLLVYEAYEGHAERRMGEVVAEARRRWPALGRVAVLHRTGEVPIGQAAVVVGAAAGHRDEAFTGARWLIDAVKASVPIWKRERWTGGDDWGLDGAALVDADQVPTPTDPVAGGR